MWVKWLFILLSVVIIGTAAFYGSAVQFSEQWVLYEALRSTASIIFAVAGVWLAIIYPDRLKSPYSKSSTDPIYRKGFKQLFSPVIHSIAVLVAVLLVGLLAPLVKQIPSAMCYIHQLRSASMAFLALLTTFQIYTVLSVLVPVLNILDKHDQDAHVVDVLSSHLPK